MKKKNTYTKHDVRRSINNLQSAVNFIAHRVRTFETLFNDYIEMQENEEDSQQAAVLATAEIFEPEAQAKAAAQLGDETATSGDTKLSADGPIKKINNVDKVKVDQITFDNESDSPEKSL